MDADWYVDPLGRYEGRYFDGEHWTEQVSDGGIAAVDPDWHPSNLPTGYVAAAVEFVEDDPDDGPAVQSIDAAPTQVHAAPLDWSVESPARTVVVIDRRALADRDAGQAPQRSMAGLAGALLGVVVLVGALLVLLPDVLSSETDDVAEAERPRHDADGSSTVSEPDTAVAGDGDDSAPGGLDADETDPEPASSSSSDDPETGTPIDPGTAVEVGGVIVANGRPVLAELAEWHRNVLSERGAAPETACFLGTVGTAVTETALCGPVAGPSDVLTFDLVPFRGTEVETGVIEIEPMLEDVIEAVPLAPDVRLVGVDGPVDAAAIGVLASEDDDGDDAVADGGDPEDGDHEDPPRGSRGQRQLPEG